MSCNSKTEQDFVLGITLDESQTCNSKAKQDFVLSHHIVCPCGLDESQTCNAKTNQDFVIGGTSDLRIHEQEGTLFA